MGDKWTKEQQQAISEREKNILVAAAAGSGKTAVLVERIVSKVLSGETDIDRLLVVTFTNAAAEEMRQRIAKKLAEAAVENPDDKRVARQLVLLNNASISTIHSFCQSVIRRNFSAIDLDPKFRMVNEQEAMLLKQDVMEELFEEEYSVGDDGFLDFVDKYSDEHGDKKLHEIVERVYNFSQSQPEPECWLEEVAGKFAIGTLEDLDKSDWLFEIRQQLRYKLLEVIKQYEYMIEQASLAGGECYISTFSDELNLAQKLLQVTEEGTWSELITAFTAVDFKRLSGKFSGNEEEKKYIQGLRDSAKKCILALKKQYFSQDADKMLQDIKETAPVVKSICRLTQKFTEKFRQDKKDRAILDFNDLEHYAFEILCDKVSSEVGYQPSAAALSLQKKYTEVMVDEYQDTNALQDAIISLVVRADNPSSFVVGDVKQSIYAFRMADSEIFQKKYDTYNKKGDKYCRIELSKNFRSRAAVLESINFIFKQVMVKEALELDYDDAATLFPGAEFADTDVARLTDDVELDIIDISTDNEQENDEALQGFEAEAVHIANRVKEMVSGCNGKEPVLVFDADVEGKYRPIRWKDIVILLRSVKSRSGILNKVLRENGIPAYASDDDGFFEETEIKVILALLNIIDNARQDIPLTAVMYSPIGGFSASELAEIRLNAPYEDMYMALLKTNEPEAKIGKRLKAKTAAFLENFSRWRELSRQVSVPLLIWQLYQDTGYYEYVGSMPGGMKRQANLRALIDRAETYEKTDFRGLFRFLRFAERMSEGETDLAAASIMGENEDVVRIMSIHKSKGLEFPVVILADIDKQFNMHDARDILLIDRRLGIGPYCIPDNDLQYPTIARQAVAAHIIQADKAEELRILYVALTRAREKLILVGKEKALAKKADYWCRYLDMAQTALPGYAVLSANSYLDWIGMAIARHKDGNAIRGLAQFIKQDQMQLVNSESSWKINIIPNNEIIRAQLKIGEEGNYIPLLHQKQALPSTEQKDAVEEILNWQYDYHGLKEVPSKLSVSEIKRRFGNIDEDAGLPFIKKNEVLFRRPDFVRNQTAMTGSEYGTLMHTVLQHIDFYKETTVAEISRQLDEMVEREIILQEERGCVQIASVQRLFSSEIGAKIKTARKIWRELPFTLLIPAERYYDVEGGKADILCQGVIDLLIEDNDDLIIVDYKTDGGISDEQAAEKYRMQINLYAEAAESLLRKKVKEKYLFMLQNGNSVPVK